MKDYIPLNVEFCLYENILCGKIIQQDDRLREKVNKYDILADNMSYRLCIYRKPELYKDMLYLRGADKRNDNKVFFYEYNNKQDAEYALKNFKELITEVNNLYADRGGIIDKTNTCLEVCE